MNMSQDSTYERFHRQIILKDFGLAGQQKLAAAKVLVVGAGGLGCPILQYLAAAGVGSIGIIDHDNVSLSNLHRQVLFNMNDLGKPKAEVAREKLLSMDPALQILTWNRYLDQRLALDIFPRFDIIVDASDNFATRYLVNDACVLLNRPLVYGAVSQFEGQVAVFNWSADGTEGLNYRDMFPEPPAEGEVLNCAEAGVLGVLPGTIGTMQAAEVIKLVTGLGKPLAGKMLCYRALDQQFFTLDLVRAERSPAPSTAEEFLATDYALLCGSSSPQEETDLLDQEGHTVVDVRELHEQPRLKIPHLQIPLAGLASRMHDLEKQKLVFICQSGKRSLQAVRIAREKGWYALSYRGGINRYIQQMQNI